jgi:hypothetical protein
MLNLNVLERKLDDALASENCQSLTDYMLNSKDMTTTEYAIGDHVEFLLGEDYIIGEIVTIYGDRCSIDGPLATRYNNVPLTKLAKRHENN